MTRRGKTPRSAAMSQKRRRTGRRRAFVDDYLPRLLLHAQHTISDDFYTLVRKHGLSVLEWRVLAALADGDAFSIGQLANLTFAKQPTITRLLDRLEARGHVKRLAAEADRRVTLVRARPEGIAAISRLLTLAREHERRMLEMFGVRAVATLKSELRKIIEQGQHLLGKA